MQDGRIPKLRICRSGRWPGWYFTHWSANIGGELVEYMGTKSYFADALGWFLNVNSQYKIMSPQPKVGNILFLVRIPSA